ncbi:MAG: restriction endonuclease subunit S [Candidatus Viridilinea halotolerans]|uniref:Restriction endonuclease subunit S n=1 Tax=Candidatus Viridilinea halotolerans TaxID=2491704 RepID=A0A426TSM5_9CHLR|nr:MAG: restriction endonuclease subunit S [Candidatus Viridilinea halotolerans]
MTNMTTGKVIQRSWMDLNGLRLDSGPYLSGAFEARVALERLQARKEPLHKVTLGGLDGIINAGRFPRTWVNDLNYGIPFLSSTDILQADLSRVSLIAKSAVAQNEKLLIREGWTLITRSGTIGRMAYSRPDMDGLACTEDVLRVIPDPERIPPGYLYAYLSSRYGVPMIVSGTYGAVIQHIEPRHIADLPVPRLGEAIEREVHNLVSEAARLRAVSSSLFIEGTSKIFSTLGIVDSQRHIWYQDQRRLGFNVKSNELRTHRALNYDPRYVDVQKIIKGDRFSYLGEICDPNFFGSGIIFKRIDADPEFAVRLVGQREAFQVRPEGRWISKASIEGLGLIVPTGTTLIAAHGTLGETELYCRSVYATERTSEYAFSGDFVRCVPLEDHILSGYLFAFLRSETAFRMLRCISTGSKQQAPQPSLLWELPIPRLVKTDEEYIHNLIQQGSHAFDKSLHLEEEAWQIVEHAIQEGS